MSLADIESDELDWYAIELVVNERLKRLGAQLNKAERREVIARLTGQLSDRDLGALIGMSGDAVFKVRKRAEVSA